jgi:adenine-specific DNA-methyltransferase
MKLQKADGSIPPLLLQRALRDRMLDTEEAFSGWVEKWRTQASSSRFDHRVECEDVVDFVAKDRGCAGYYADPPYTIDHYSRFYHVLETLVRRDNPRLAEMKKSGEPKVMRGVYRFERHQSHFCIPSEAPAAFEQLISETAQRRAPLVLSYSPFDEKEGHRPRLLSLDDLVNIGKRHYRKVEVMEVSEHSHRKLNAKAANLSIRADAERLLICEI